MSVTADSSHLSPNDVRDQLRRALGEGPIYAAPSPPRQIGTKDYDDYQLLEYEYTNGVGERVPLTIAEPRHRRFAPAVIAIHQTNDCGRREVFGLAGDPTLDYGSKLARRGHRVFAIDLGWTGERAAGQQWDKDGFYREHSRWSMIGKAVQDIADLCRIMQGDFAEAPPYGCIGHSLGGVVGYFFAALHADISRLACNASYFSAPTEGDPWSAQLYTSQVLNPGLGGFCIARHLDLVISLATVHADVLLTYYRDDTIIEWPCPSDSELARMKTFSRCIQVVGLPGGHAFPDKAQDRSYRFLEEGPRD